MQDIKLSDIIATRITSKFKKDEILIIVGEKGSGKSYSALFLAEQIATKVAAKKGGDPKQYFNIDHVSIINPLDLMAKLQNMQKHGVYVLDDLGASPELNARRFMSRNNQVLNGIFQVCRTEGACIIVTTPQLSLIDKNLRALATHVAQVAESRHSSGMNFLKVFKVNSLPREGNKILYSHLQLYEKNGTNKKVLRWLVRMPSRELMQEYDRLRSAKAKELINKELAMKQTEDARVVGKVAAKDATLVEQYGETILQLKNKQIKARDIAAQVDLSEYMVRKIASKMDAPFVRVSS